GAAPPQPRGARPCTAAAPPHLRGASGATPPPAGVPVTAGSASSGGDLIAGQISGKDVQLTAYGKPGGGSLTIGGAVNAGHNVTVLGQPGLGPVMLKINAGITAKGAITASGQDVAVAPSVVLRSDAQGAGAGDLQITAAGSFTADASSQLLGGSGPSPVTAGVSVT